MSEITITEAQLGKIRGKVAVVTGGGSGIGKAMAEIMSRNGATVAIGDLNQEAGRSFADAAKSQGLSIEFFLVDVTQWESQLTFFKEVKDKYNRIDLVFANAGIGDQNTCFEDLVNSEDSLLPPNLKTIDVSVTGAIYTTKLSLYYMKQNNPPGGGLVITGSTSSYNERPNLPLYSTAKHAVVGLMRAMRHRVTEDNINIGLVAPGGTESGLFTAEAASAFRSMGIPVNTPEVVALGAIYLANNKSMNGKALTIIGGRYTEVEQSILDTQESWYGKYNTEMAQMAASIRLDRLAK